MNHEAERIKDRLRACTTAAEVGQVANEERAAVVAMAETDNTEAIIISNLKAWTLSGLVKKGAP